MPATSPFVGRTAELAALDAALDDLDRGAPVVVEVVGAAGLGKTRLLAELARRAEDRRHLVLAGSGAELEQDLPFWVWVDALDEYVEGLDPRRVARLAPSLRAELAQVLPAMSDERGAPGGAVHERYRVHRAVRELLEQLALTQPLVLVLDDMHWADAASVDLLVALLHRPPAAGVLLAVGARPRRLPARLASALDRALRDGGLTRLELQALTPQEAEALVGRAVGALYEESGGNPFYLEQLARLPGAATAGRSGSDVPLAGLEVPPLVAAALSGELALLSDRAQRVLDGASVAGDPFELDLAAAASALPEPEVLDGLDELVRGELVHVTDLPRRFRFRHPIVRRAVYEATPGGWRIAAHERVAELLAERGASATARAHHVERSARHGDPRAIAALREAGADAATRAPDTAARWLAAALRLLPDTAPAADRVQLVLARAQALIATGRFRDGHAALKEGIELVGDGEAASLRVQLAATCARVEHLLGLHEQAHDRLVGALEDLPDERTPEGAALMVELTMDGAHRMRYGAMAEWGARAAAAAGALGDDALRAAALAAAARGAAFAGRTEEAQRRCDEAAGLIDGLPDHVLARRLDALAFLAGGELYTHRFAAAHAHAARAIAIGRRTGQSQQFPLLHAILGQTASMQGRSQDVVGVLDDAVEAARLTGNAQTLAWSLYPRANAALLLGDVATALSAAQEAVDVVSDGTPSHHAAYAAFVLAQAHLELGEAARAVELLEGSAGGPAMPLAALSFRATFLEALASAHVAAGDAAAAARAATCARTTAGESGLPLEVAAADRAEAAVALDGGEAGRAAELALAAAARQRAGGAAVEAARSLALAGRALGAAGEGDRARAALEEAAGTFAERGSVRWRDAAERELRRLGHRVHRRAEPAGATGEGVAGLSPRELEVARLIVDRKTNREIAEALFLSPKTVETHVRNLFAKLGAGSRVEVARIVERADRMAGS